MDKKCFVFDLDGTLLDTLSTINYYLSKTLVSAGFSAVDEGACCNFVGEGSKMLLVRALAAQGCFDSELAARLRGEYVSAYNRDPYYLTEPYDGIPELLSELKARGYRLAILSNKPHSSVVPIAEHFFPGIFDIVRGAEDGLALKPSPDQLFKILEELSVSPSECVFVGDTGIDIETAKNAGAFAAGVLWGFRGREELSEAGADIIAQHASRLLTID